MDGIIKKKKAKRGFKKGFVRVIKIFLKKKNKRHQYACERKKNLSEEEKNKEDQYGHEHFKNLPEDEKQRLAEYRKSYSKIRKKKVRQHFF